MNLYVQKSKWYREPRVRLKLDISWTPLGYILGPTFVLAYIKDLTEDLRCNIKPVADDTWLFTVIEDSNAAANDMNHDLELINQWAHNWGTSFTPDQQKHTVELTF